MRLSDEVVGAIMQSAHWEDAAPASTPQACTKTGYKTQNGARRAATLAQQRGVNMHTYKCPICHLWHVSSTRKLRKP